MIKFPRHLNPRALVEALITTPELREAWDLYTHAIREHGKLDDARELGTSKLQQQHSSYAAELKDAATNGNDLSKIKAPPSTFDSTAIDAQQEVWADKAIEALQRIHELLLKEAPAAGDSIITQLEAAEQEVFDAIETVKQKLATVDQLNRRRHFYRQLQLFPLDMPNVNQAPMNPSQALSINATKEITASAMNWRVDELTTKDRLIQDALKLSTDHDERNALNDAGNDIVRSRLDMIGRIDSGIRALD